MLIGAPGFDASDVLTDSGRAYVILGRPSPWPASIALEGADSAGNMVALDGDREDNASGTRLAHLAHR